MNYSAIPLLAPFSQGPHMGIKYSICNNYTQWTNGIAQLVVLGLIPSTEETEQNCESCNPSIRRQRQEDQEFTAILHYILSMRPASDA